MNHLSSRTQLKSLATCLNKRFPPAGILLERTRPCLILQVRKKRYVNTWSDRLYQNWLRITCSTSIQRGTCLACPITPMVSPWKRWPFVFKNMLKIFPAYLQPRKDFWKYSSVLEELNKHRFFKKLFIQQILYGTHYYLDIHQYSHTRCYWKTFLYHLCLY